MSKIKWGALRNLAEVAGRPCRELYASARLHHSGKRQLDTEGKAVADQGVELAFDTPDQLRDRLARELVKWRKIVETSGARVD